MAIARQTNPPELCEDWWKVDIYDRFKGRVNTQASYHMHFDFLLRVACGVFEYDKLPDSIDPDKLEEYLCMGSVGWGKIKDRLVVTPSYPSGEPNDYGIGTELIGVTPKGRYKGVIGEDVAVGFNNHTKTPDLPLWYYAHLLKVIDTSMECLSYGTRYSRMPLVKDQAMKTAMDAALSDMEQGKRTTFILEDEMLEFMGRESDKGKNNILDLTDVSLADKIQYLSKYRDDIYRWALAQYGYNLNSNGKMAQQSIEELNGGDSVGFSFIYEKLICRQKMIDMVNKVFDLDISVHLNPILQMELAKYKSTFCPDSELEFENDIINIEGTHPGEDSGEDSSEDVSEDPGEDVSEDVGEDSGEDSKEGESEDDK